MSSCRGLGSPVLFKHYCILNWWESFWEGIKSTCCTQNKSQGWSKLLNRTNMTPDAQNNKPYLNLCSHEDMTNRYKNIASSKIYVTLLCLPDKIQTASLFLLQKYTQHFAFLDSLPQPAFATWPHLKIKNNWNCIKNAREERSQPYDHTIIQYNGHFLVTSSVTSTYYCLQTSLPAGDFTVRLNPCC